MHNNRYFVTNYIDNLIGCNEPETAFKTFQFLKNLIIKLGLVISENKLYEQQKCSPCLSINVNIKTGIISISEEKLGEIVALCLDRSTRGKSNKKALQSLVGSLLYIHKCVRPGRLFVNRILATLWQTSNDGTVTLSTEFKRDMAWFNVNLPVFNGKVYFDNGTKPTITNLYVDGCLTGVGGAWLSLVYALPLGRLVSLPIPCTIVHCIYNTQHVETQTERQSCCHSLRQHGSRSILSWDQFLGTVARNICLVTATHNIYLTVQHIAGKVNGLADALSRRYGGQLHHSKVSALLHRE